MGASRGRTGHVGRTGRGGRTDAGGGALARFLVAAWSAVLLGLLVGHPVRLTAAPARTADTLSVDSLRALTERASRLAEQGQHAAAGALYELAARGSPEAAGWLRLSALQQAGRAGLPDWARSLAEILRRDSILPADSIELEQARAALLAAHPDSAAALRPVAEGMDPAWDAELWTHRVGPVLLASGDTAAAVAGYRRALQSAGVPAAAGSTLVVLKPGWKTQRDVALSDRREGRERRAANLLGRALTSAPRDRDPALALELARVRADGGLPGVRRVVERWASRSSTPDSIRAALELELGTWELGRGRTSRADAAFRRAASGSGPAAARASYLVADLAHDRRHLITARTWLERTSRRFPRSGYGGLALMRLGFLDYLEGRYEPAVRRFVAYRRRSPDGEWSRAALYWEARTREALGDSVVGHGLLERLAADDPAGYYGLRARFRLSDRPDPTRSALAADSDSAAGSPEDPPDSQWEADVDGLLRRMDLLLGLGWRSRALAELDAARRDLSTSPERRLGLARRLERAGWAGPAIGMAWSVFAAWNGQWNPSLLRAVYPLPYRDAIVRAARRVGIDPALLAGVVRQESAFDPTVVSSAGAIGLTQLLPSTARRVARRVGLPAPDSSDLLEPSVSIRLGAHYLGELLHRYDGSRLAALVAYNAGPIRWDRWKRLPEHASDPELFIEAIPYAETRRYVKAVLRNELLYRWLHGLAAPRPASASAGSDSTAAGSATGGPGGSVDATDGAEYDGIRVPHPVHPHRRLSMARGTVKWFNDAKGYGFIEAPEAGEDIFVHYSAIDMDGFKTLAEGQEVEFELAEGDKGLHATRVTRVSEATA